MHLNGFSPVWFPSWIFTWCGIAPVTFGALHWLFPSWILWWWCNSMVVSFKYFLMVLQVSWEALAKLYALEWLLSIVIPFKNRDMEKLLRLQFLHGSSNGTLSISILRSSCHTLCNWMASLQCDSLHESSPASGGSAKCSAVYYIQHKSGHNLDLNRKTGNPRPLQ